MRFFQSAALKLMKRSKICFTVQNIVIYLLSIEARKTLKLLLTENSGNGDNLQTVRGTVTRNCYANMASTQIRKHKTSDSTD